MVRLRSPEQIRVPLDLEPMQARTQRGRGGFDCAVSSIRLTVVARYRHRQLVIGGSASGRLAAIVRAACNVIGSSGVGGGADHRHL